MLVRFSENYFKQVVAILYFNWRRLSVIAIIASAVAICTEVLEIDCLSITVIPASILGGALAIFLAFRNNTAYDRWWEARKIWGGIVNYSRSWGIEITTLLSPIHGSSTIKTEELNRIKKTLIYRHIAWINALRFHLRKQDKWEELAPFLSSEEQDSLKEMKNKPTQLVRKQAEQIAKAHEMGIIDDFRHMEIMRTMKEFYNLQGKCERIKNTIPPYYYTYFTRMFLWFFFLILPFSLVGELHWAMIPISCSITFVFSVLESTGTITDNPFEGLSVDTPLTALCRTIEIDLRQMLGETDLPEKVQPIESPLGAVHLD